MPRLRHASTFFFPLFAAALPSQSWQLASPPTTPPARAGQVMATDLANGRVLMFGGYAGASYLGDCWSYDGSNWTAVTGTLPPARMRAAMAFDESRAAYVMFGGVNGISTSSWLAGTWEYANGAWSQRPSTLFPPKRQAHAMAYDAVRQRVVMFGGRTNAGTIFLQDTWEWDGSGWAYFTPAHAPTPRQGQSMAFDLASGHVLLFGGLQLGGPFVGDTWSWDGVDWTQLSPAHSPSARANQSMATDRARGRVVLRGGYDGGDLTDTWEWDGSDWQFVLTGTPSNALGLAGMATGPTGAHVVMFGGDDNGLVASTTWRYGRFAAATPIGIGCGVPPLTLAPAAGSLPELGTTFVSEVGAGPAGALPFLSYGLTAADVDLGPLGMPGCHLYHDLTLLGIWCTPAGAVWTSSLPLANQPSLAGIEFYAQAYALAPGANPFGFVTSNALQLTLGLP